MGLTLCCCCGNRISAEESNGAAVDVCFDSAQKHYVFSWVGDEAIHVYIPENDVQGIIGQGSGSDIRMEVDGVALAWHGFVTPDLPSPTKATYALNAAEKQLTIRHDNGFDVTVFMRPDNKTLYFQMSHAGENAEIGMGSFVASTVDKLYLNFGLVLSNGDGTLSGTINYKGWEQLESKFVGADLSSGLSLIQAEDVLPNRLEFAGDRVSLRCVLKRPYFKLIVTGKGIQEAVSQYRDEVFSQQGRLGDPTYLRHVRELAGRSWLGMWSQEHFDRHRARLERAFAFGLDGDLAVLIHKWHRYGYDVNYPDFFPANPELGGNEVLLKIRTLCAEHDALFGLHENYADYDDDAPSYSRDDAIVVNKRFVRRNLRDYNLLLPHKILKYAEPNAEKIRGAFGPTLAFIDAFDNPMDAFVYTDPPKKAVRSYTYQDTAGNHYTVDEAEAQVLEAYTAISRYYDAPIVAEDGGEWSIGYAHGAEVNLRDPAFTKISGYSDWEFFPWLSYVYRDVYNFLGVGYQGRYNYDRYNAGLLWTDDYRSTMLLVGHNTAGYAEGDDWVEKFLKRHYLFYDFAEETTGAAMARVDFNGENIHQQIVDYANGVRVYVNRGKSQWEVEGKTLGQYGFLFTKSPGRLLGYCALVDGEKVDYARSARGEYLNSYGRAMTVGNISTTGAAVRVDCSGRWSRQAKTDASIGISHTVDVSGAERIRVGGGQGFAYCSQLPFAIVPEAGIVTVKDVEYDESHVQFTLEGYRGVASVKVRDGAFAVAAGRVYLVDDNGKTVEVAARADKTLEFDLEGKGARHQITITPVN